MYKRVEYLESTGTQYIDTGLIPHSKETIYVDISFMMSNDASADNCLLGCTRNENGGTNAYYDFKFPNWCNEYIEVRGYGISNNSVTELSKNIKSNMIFDYKNGSQVITKDGVVVWNTGYTYRAASEAIYANLYMFCINNGGTKVNWKAKAKIYSCYIKLDNDIHNFLPVIRISDSKPGMYDSVTDTFFMNEGDGEFAYGPEIYD